MTQIPASEIPLPPVELRFMNEDDSAMFSVGEGLAEVLRRHGLPEDGEVLDIGSGYGRLAIGLLSSGFVGRYTGVEILKKHVTWCQEELTPATGSRFQFHHLDVRNGRYNPGGAISPAEVRFPVEAGSQDCCALFSVFTHMYAADIRRYLREIRRTLKPGGIAVTTWFVYDAKRLPAVLSEEKTPFPMVNEINEVTRYNDPKDPLRAIAYRERYVRRLIAQSGLDVRAVEYGRWCGDDGKEFQDVFVLSKSLPRTLTRWERLRRRMRRADAWRSTGSARRGSSGR